MHFGAATDIYIPKKCEILIALKGWSKSLVSSNISIIRYPFEFAYIFPL